MFAGVDCLHIFDFISRVIAAMPYDWCVVPIPVEARSLVKPCYNIQGARAFISGPTSAFRPCQESGKISEKPRPLTPCNARVGALSMLTAGVMDLSLRCPEMIPERSSESTLQSAWKRV